VVAERVMQGDLGEAVSKWVLSLLSYIATRQLFAAGYINACCARVPMARQQLF